MINVVVDNLIAVDLSAVQRLKRRINFRRVPRSGQRVPTRHVTKSQRITCVWVGGNYGVGVKRGLYSSCGLSTSCRSSGSGRYCCWCRQCRGRGKINTRISAQSVNCRRCGAQTTSRKPTNNSTQARSCSNLTWVYISVPFAYGTQRLTLGYNISSAFFYSFRNRFFGTNL